MSVYRVDDVMRARFDVARDEFRGYRRLGFKCPDCESLNFKYSKLTAGILVCRDCNNVYSDLENMVIVKHCPDHGRFWQDRCVCGRTMKKTEVV